MKEVENSSKACLLWYSIIVASQNCLLTHFQIDVYAMHHMPFVCVCVSACACACVKIEQKKAVGLYGSGVLLKCSVALIKRRRKKTPK